MKNSIRKTFCVVAVCVALAMPGAALAVSEQQPQEENASISEVPLAHASDSVLPQDAAANGADGLETDSDGAPQGDAGAVSGAASNISAADGLGSGATESSVGVSTQEVGTTEPEDVLPEVTKPQVTAEISSDGSCRLTWTAIRGAQKYAIAVWRDNGWYTYTYNYTNTWFDLSGLEAGRTYEFLVQSYDGTSWSSFDDADIVKVTWDGSTAPKNVVGAPAGDGTVALTWDTVPGATVYAVAEKLANGSYHTFTYSCIDTAYTVSDLSNGHPHRFLVQAFVDGAWSPVSDYLLVEVTPEGATKPSVSVRQSSNSCVLSWNKVSGATRYAIAVRNDDGSWRTYDYNYRGTSFTLSDLTAGRSYEFIVQAYVNGSWSSFDQSDIITVKYVDATSPQNVQVESTSNDGELMVSWDAVEGASQYAVAELLPNGSYKALNNNIGAGQLFFTVWDVWPGRAHSYLVQAFVNGRWSPISRYLTVSATPNGDAKPVVQAMPTNGGVSLSWNRVPGASCYTVAVRVGSIWHTYTSDLTSTSFGLSGMDAGNPYHFVVQAKINGTWTDFSDDDIVTAQALGGIPASPRPLFYVSYSNNAIHVYWEPVPGATRYAIAQQLPGGSYSTYTLNATGNSYTITNFPDGGNRTYKILVQAYKNGQWSDFSSSDTRSVYVPAQLSEAERLLVARAQKYNYFSRTSYLILVDVTRTDIGIFQYDGGWHLIKYFQCSCGAPSTPTVIGQFELGAKGYSFGAGTGHTCYWWSQIYHDYLFHSVLYKEGSHTEFVDDRIGYHVSGGCVRLQIDNAKYIYDNIPSGTKVVTYL